MIQQNYFQIICIAKFLDILQQNLLSVRKF